MQVMNGRSPYDDMIQAIHYSDTLYCYPMSSYTISCFFLQEERVELFAKLVETLLEVVCQTGAPATGHFRAVVCACLQELETSLPVSTVKPVIY